MSNTSMKKVTVWQKIVRIQKGDDVVEIKEVKKEEEYIVNPQQGKSASYIELIPESKRLPDKGRKEPYESLHRKWPYSLSEAA